MVTLSRRYNHNDVGTYYHDKKPGMNRKYPPPPTERERCWGEYDKEEVPVLRERERRGKKGNGEQK
jgi:hypothetical protein